MDWSYLIAAGGKEGFRERIFVHTTNLTATPTVGVAVNTSPTVFTSTEAMLVVDNTASVNSSTGAANVWVIPVAIDMVVTNGSTGTFWAIRLSMDNATQYSSGGTTLAAALTAYDTRSGYTDRVPYARCAFGDVTLSGGSSRKVIGVYPISPGSAGLTVGSHVHMSFGQNEGSHSGQFASTSGTAAVVGVFDVTKPLPLISIGRSCSMILQPFASTVTDLSFTVQVTCLEVGHPREAA